MAKAQRKINKRLAERIEAFNTYQAPMARPGFRKPGSQNRKK